MESSTELITTIRNRLSQQLPHPRIWIGLLIIISLMLIVSLIMAVPAILEMQAFNNTTENAIQDTMAQYAAESGIAEAMWRFKNQQSTFTPTSPVGSSYILPDPVNNMTVHVKLLKYTRIGTADCYIIQSSAPPEPNSRSRIYVEIQQDGTTTTLTKYVRQ